MSVTVLIADDTESIRKAVKVLLAEESDIRIAGEAVNFREAISKASILKPDVLLLDLHISDDCTLERAHIKAQLELRRSQVKIIAYVPVRQR
jgi:chemotaxis response regulator CheB